MILPIDNDITYLEINHELDMNLNLRNVLGSRLPCSDAKW